MRKRTPSGELVRSVGFLPAAAIVVANMIGAGIFTTSGFQAASLGHPGYILALWVVGGILALCGALCYAELGAAIPRAGGEYQYLREAFGGSFAWMSAVVSLTAGFSAPIASALKSLCQYLARYVPALGSEERLVGRLSLADLTSVALVWLLVAAHSRKTSFGLGVTSAVTALKVGGILIFLLAAVLVGTGDVSNFSLVAPELVPSTRSALFSALGTSLIFVMFCYSGWNSAAYLAGELKNPARDLPRALLVGTAIVTALYFGLNCVYLYAADVSRLAGKVEVALVAAENLFGSAAAALVVSVLCVSLFAAASAMTAVGPRVYYAAGRDHLRLGFLATVDPETGAPRQALVVQGVVTSAFILVGKIDQIQQYAGFTLSLFATLAVVSLIVLRVRRPELPRPFRVPGYPVVPGLFILVSAWTMFWALRGRPLESILGLLTVALSGLALPLLDRQAGATSDGP